jgi:hypothetical protein
VIGSEEKESENFTRSDGERLLCGHLREMWQACADETEEASAVPTLLRQGGGFMTELLPCGTAAAYRRHLKRGEPACVLCVEGYRAYRRSRYSVENGYECGTQAGFMRHLAYREDPCESCRAAFRNYAAAMRSPEAKKANLARSYRIADEVWGAYIKYIRTGVPIYDPNRAES